LKENISKFVIRVKSAGNFFEIARGGMNTRSVAMDARIDVFVGIVKNDLISSVKR